MTLAAALERSKKKGREFLFAGRENGWDIAAFNSNRDVFFMQMNRPDTEEWIAISWRNGFLEDEIKYTHKDRTAVLANADVALQRMREEPLIRAVVAAKRLPFVVGETPESEIIKAVFGKKIVWINSISGRREEAVVRGNRHLRIVSGQAGRPILTFVDTAVTGFRSVALEKILQVS